MELLGLQDRTVLEVRAAGEGRRLLRLGTSGLFAEYAAPGLISLFAERAKDLDVELSVHPTAAFEQILVTRTVDATIGPRPARADLSIASTLFLNYEVVAVAGPDHAFAHTEPSVHQLRDQTWLLGPSAAEESGVIPGLIRRIGVPEEHQQIFQSHAAALETRKGQTVEITKSENIKGDLFLTGNRIVIDGTVDGDVYAFGQDIEVNGRITGDLLTAAQTVRDRRNAGSASRPRAR